MLRIDPRDSKSIYEQITDGIKEQVLRGILKPNEQLPSVRQLASMLTVNANTVAKAYAQLEREGIIETIRGKGAFVAMMPSKVMNEKEWEQVKKNLKASCIAMHYMGFEKDQVLDEVGRIYDELMRGDKA